MPYITPQRKYELATIPHQSPVNAGELTYALQTEICNYLLQKQLSYAALAECLGALEGAKVDLVERVLKPYETKKRVENGDVWPESLLSEGGS
jgi:hypothetical protein